MRTLASLGTRAAVTHLLRAPASSPGAFGSSSFLPEWVRLRTSQGRWSEPLQSKACSSPLIFSSPPC